MLTRCYRGALFALHGPPKRFNEFKQPILLFLTFRFSCALFNFPTRNLNRVLAACKTRPLNLYRFVSNLKVREEHITATTITYNFLGIKPEQEFVSAPLSPGKHSLGMEFIREKAGANGESMGTTKLYVDGKEVAKGPMRAQIGKFTLAGDGLCVGFDSGDTVSQQYQTPGRFTGGEVQGVAVDVSDKAYVDLQRDAAAAFETD